MGAVSASKGVINLTVKAPVAGTGFSVSYASGMGSDHVADGGVGGSDGNKGVDVVLDFVDYDAAHAGFRWGVAAQTEIMEVTCNRISDGAAGEASSCNNGYKHNPYAGSMFTKLQLGPLHLGTQATFKNLATTKSTSVMNTRTVIGGAALVFGDTLSISYGVGRDKYRYNNRNRGLAAQVGFGQIPGGVELGGDANEYVTQKYEGWSAALNLGPVALKGTRNNVRSVGQGAHTGIYAEGDTHSEINLSIAF